MGPSKNDVEIERIHARADMVEQVCGLVCTAVWALAVVGCTYIVMAGLAALGANGPEGNLALAAVVERLRIDTITAYIFGAGGVGYGVVQNFGKRRAIREKGRLQHQMEQGEPNRTSSKLTEFGDPPDAE